MIGEPNICYSTKDFIDDFQNADIGGSIVDQQAFFSREQAERAFERYQRQAATSRIDSFNQKEIKYQMVSLVCYSYEPSSRIPGHLGANQIVENYDSLDQIVLDEKFSLDEEIPSQLVQYECKCVNGVHMVQYYYAFRNGEKKHLRTVLTDHEPTDHLECILLYREALGLYRKTQKC